MSKEVIYFENHCQADANLLLSTEDRIVQRGLLGKLLRLLITDVLLRIRSITATTAVVTTTRFISKRST